MNSKLIHLPIIFFFLCFSILVKGEDKITWQNPLLHGNTLMSSSFIDASTGWTVGYFGTIMKTTDSGKTWENQVSGTTVTLSSVSLVDKNTGGQVAQIQFLIQKTAVKHGVFLHQLLL
jgi:photosystem II stability/assembly factor-like uncharacterized protein